MILSRSLLIITVVLAILLAPMPTDAQILGSGQCRLTPIRVSAGGTVCERLCFRRDYRGPPSLCRRIPRDAVVPVCGGGCCRSGPNCLQLLYT
uniref:Uncharacterized protein, isoform A n=1 Tax=Drosophila melanogaster TaxID=7227 RepID=X2JD42_DROME|nr:uncharacterized protein Dmel_CG45081, isoform A [Drosophila melanogaster]NP_001287117.1 uncharacterized protein Dmel_CG45081, isoform B [Drosophila melanogaster]AHN58141.1 uncharacterized protein Dmel_CG45081, isoform A [Drosophila melanogaster]AHN58142.1 uncharacterized protein Dmel_CG45081, isoform B [Drosophila melanogaster]|eukprot:NP_001287116.1 uncharacterized protein Dmel_CG45081, isoform A [Drosophila melanogaster]